MAHPLFQPQSEIEPASQSNIATIIQNELYAPHHRFFPSLKDAMTEYLFDTSKVLLYPVDVVQLDPDINTIIEERLKGISQLHPGTAVGANQTQAIRDYLEQGKPLPKGTISEQLVNIHFKSVHNLQPFGITAFEQMVLYLRELMLRWDTETNSPQIALQFMNHKNKNEVDAFLAEYTIKHLCSHDPGLLRITGINGLALQAFCEEVSYEYTEFVEEVKRGIRENAQDTFLNGYVDTTGVVSKTKLALQFSTIDTLMNSGAYTADLVHDILTWMLSTEPNDRTADRPYFDKMRFSSETLDPSVVIERLLAAIPESRVRQWSFNSWEMAAAQAVDKCKTLTASYYKKFPYGTPAPRTLLDVLREDFSLQKLLK